MQKRRGNDPRHTRHIALPMDSFPGAGVLSLSESLHPESHEWISLGSMPVPYPTAMARGHSTLYLRVLWKAGARLSEGKQDVVTRKRNRCWAGKSNICPLPSPNAEGGVSGTRTWIREIFLKCFFWVLR